MAEAALRGANSAANHPPEEEGAVMPRADEGLALLRRLNREQ